MQPALGSLGCLAFLNPKTFSTFLSISTPSAAKSFNVPCQIRRWPFFLNILPRYSNLQSFFLSVVNLHRFGQIRHIGTESLGVSADCAAHGRPGNAVGPFQSGKFMAGGRLRRLSQAHPRPAIKPLSANVDRFIAKLYGKAAKTLVAYEYIAASA